MTTTVSRPDPELREPFLLMLDDYETHDPENGEFYASARTDFNAYIAALHNEERGIDLPSGFVPCSHRWLLNEAGNLSVSYASATISIRPFYLGRRDISDMTFPLHSVDAVMGLRACGQDYCKRESSVLIECSFVRMLAIRLHGARSNVVGERWSASSASEHYRCLVRRYWIMIA